MRKLFYFLVYVKVQSKCTISPKSPSSLTAEGGRLANNTKDVEIECRCVSGRGATLNNTKWFSPARNLVEEDKIGNDHGAPYYLTKNNVTVLVVPNFSDDYDGEYVCAAGSNDTNTNAMAMIRLICKDIERQYRAVNYFTWVRSKGKGLCFQKRKAFFRKYRTSQHIPSKLCNLFSL